MRIEDDALNQINMKNYNIPIPPKVEILSLLKRIIENNEFTFEGKLF